MLNTRKKHLLLALLAVASGSAAFAAAPVKVQILSAVVKDQRIAGATVILQKNGAQSATAVTNASGDAALAPAFSEADDGVLMLIKMAGYSTLVAKCPCNGMTYAISPVMSSLDGMRVVLNWGAEPPDLDSHIVYPGNHIFWDAKVGANANLDVDDTTSFGPETITVEKKHFGEKYVYAVHSYSDLDHPGSSGLSASNAKVFVYIGQSLIRTYYVPKNKPGNLWVVFAVDGQGDFHDINAMEAATNLRGRLDPSTLKEHLGAGDYTPDRASGADAVGEAKRINKLGEDAYHAKRNDDAIDYYRQAIDLDPYYGQAYSNLGLAYQKAGRIAEAIWANRKAIALASGDTAAQVRASSYYNIAKIYENAGQFADAQRQYEFAQHEKPGKVYEDAIARMKAKQGK